MNATLQVLNNAPDLVQQVTSLTAAPSQYDLQQNLAIGARDLFKTMKTAHEPVKPFAFLTRMRQLYPQFDQRGEGDMPMQQDAEECLTQIMQVLNNKCKAPGGEALIDHLFGVHMDVKLKCAETDAEGETSEEEKLLKLSCHIDGSVPTGDGGSKGGTDLITQSISKGLEGTLEKMSPSLGRLAVYNKSYRIKRLPKFLLTQFVRFYWKQDTQKKAKILRQVKFPMLLDMKEYCTDEYQARIQKYRDQALKKQEEEKAALKKQKLGKTDEPKPEEKKEGEGAAATEGAAGASGGEGAAGGDAMDVDLSAEEDLWANYELTGVLTHQGRSADGGHYVAWIRKDSGTWYKFDDDKVTEIKEDDVKKLYGGGDWHMAYICLYQRTEKVIGTNSTRY
jgi:ubiquitin carboxyl-terminal hydrolase 14